MCTLTVVPLAGSRLRLAFNRDERPDRPAGLGPRQRRFGDREALLPIDPAAGGTWLAVNDAGLALALLNVTSENPAAAGVALRSRGAIIPALLGTASPSAALAVAEQGLDYSTFAPFRLVLVGQGVVADVRWDGREPMVMSRLLGGRPLLFTSSGLGDQLVDGARRELLDELFGGAPETWERAQEAFHRHRWPGREHLSVNMTRTTARTVSHSVIDLDPAEALFTYHPAAPDQPAERVSLRLPLIPGAA
jgi:hypothetical protein